MAIGFESFIKEGDKNERSIVGDIVATCSSKGNVSFTSKGVKYLMYEYPLKDQRTGKEFGLITDLVKVEKDKLKVCYCDLTISTKPKRIHLYKRLPASDEIKEYYLAEDTSCHTPPFVVETVNRHAVRDEKLEDSDVNVGISAFAGKVLVYDNLDEYNKHFDFFPMDTPEGQVVGFSRDFVITNDEDSDDPYTIFLGEVLSTKDVKVKLTENEIEFSIIEVDCFLGTLKVVAGRDCFDLSKLEKGKLLEISAWIKADFGVDPAPEAIVDGRTKKTKKAQDDENVNNVVTRLADAGYDVSSELTSKVRKVIKKAAGIRRKKD